MHTYQIIKQFTDVDGSHRLPGETVTLSDERAARLRYHRIIGGQIIVNPKEPEAAVVPVPEIPEKVKPEAAVVNHVESRKRKN